MLDFFSNDTELKLITCLLLVYLVILFLGLEEPLVLTPNPYVLFFQEYRCSNFRFLKSDPGVARRAVTSNLHARHLAFAAPVL
jgi:hypothetical protein